MSWSAFRTFTDPDAYHTAFRDTRTASVIIGRGDFRAYFVTAQLERLSLQGGNETLPRTVYSAVDPRQWQPSDSSSVPRQLRLLDFPSRPGIAPATAGQTRSPRFRRDPFVRDVASDPGIRYWLPDPSKTRNTHQWPRSRAGCDRRVPRSVRR